MAYEVPGYRGTWRRWICALRGGHAWALWVPGVESCPRCLAWRRTAPPEANPWVE